jgi:transcriptional regulator with XRE-family HTH domain
MKKYVTNGARIKQLRERLDRGSKQATFANAIGISERLLRDVENKNAPLPLAKIEHIARALHVHRYEVMLADVTDELTATAQPPPILLRPPPPPPTAPPPVCNRLRGIQLCPRFDDERLGILDAQELFEGAHRARRLITHINAKLTNETEEYAAEMMVLLKDLTWDVRGFDDVPGDEALPIQKRLRELLVLLKGNDVWVYGDTMLKYMPESFEVVARDQRSFESELVVAFGPAGEYGETSIRVRYDHGQPREINWDSPPGSSESGA